MNKDLYFIPIIARALDAPQKGSALAGAFAAIERFGRQKQYQRGFEQFRRFMEAVADRAVRRDRQPPLSEMSEALLVELALGVLGGSGEKETAQALVNSHPRWRKHYDALRAQCKDADALPYATRVSLERQGKEIQTVVFETVPETASIGDVSPGLYTLRLSTGRVLWEGAIVESDVLWHHAFPERALDLAADTREISPEPTREIRLMNGEVLVRLYPGIESGRMSITLERPEGTKNA